jgi:uncharacterized protein with HEPN domain
MNERDETRLEWIKEEIEFVLKITCEHSLESFLNDDLVQHGVTMALINIAESVKSLSSPLKQEHQHIEWQDITNFRNIAAHNYDGLRMEWIFEIVTRDIPELLEQVERILHDGKVKSGK